MDHAVSVLLVQARAGDQGARENLISNCRSFVHQTAGALQSAWNGVGMMNWYRFNCPK